LPTGGSSRCRCATGYSVSALQEVTRNFPVLGVGWVLRRLVFPFGFPARPASHAVGKAAVRAVLGPGEVRDRLTRNIYISHDANDPQGILEVALDKVIEAEPAERKIEKALKSGMLRRSLDRDWIGDAESKGIITAEEAKLVRETEDLILRVISVDDFPAELITGRAAATGPGAPQAGDGQPSREPAAASHEQPRESEPVEAEASDRRGDGGGVQAAE